MREPLHQEIEALAGAIALGEASDADRRRYREHIAGCAECLQSLGGEHELERTAATVGAARDSEIWAPDGRNVFIARKRPPAGVLNFGAGFVLTAIAFALGLHYTTIAQPARMAPVASDVIAVHDVNPTPSLQLPRRLVVLHHVVQYARAPMVLPNPPHSGNPHTATVQKPSQIAMVTVYPQVPRTQNVTLQNAAQPNWRTVSRMTTTAISETAPQHFTSAESLQIDSLRRAQTTRDAAPIGGDTAINPQPPMIAYAEGAEGTTVFEVMIDERGAPAKCVIAQSSGYRFLDDAVCRAATKAHYTPKTVNGNPVPGVYRDAFTFRVNDNVVDGLPRPIHLH